jgi:hypothetical protein
MSTVYHWFDQSSALKTFTFTFSVGPSVKFHFDKTPAKTWEKRRPFKRRRPLWDVDGSHIEGKKKRRLRLNLITSRLSRPFSQPASNIIDRGFSRIAIWAKQRRTDQNVLRKAAIMNRVRSRLDTVKASAAKAAMARPPPTIKDVVPPKPPRCYELPLPPSPLGLSNYDALDLEDEMFGIGEDGEEYSTTVYSDFNVMDTTHHEDGDEYDYLDELDGIPHDIPEERPPPPPDDRMVEMMKEKERQREICFVKFIA